MRMRRVTVDLSLQSFVSAGALTHAEGSRAFYEAKQAAGGQLGPTSYDELLAARAALPPEPTESRAIEYLAHADTGEVSVRITRPSSGKSRAAYLDIHGGGFFMDSAARGDVRNAGVADALSVTVVSVDYRLAPEHPWPAAPDDCETAALWLAGEGRELFDTDRFVIRGASAGATLAATTLLRLRNRGPVNTCAGAVLLFGAYDLSGLTPGGRLYGDEWFIQSYAGHVDDRSVPDVSPLFGDLRGLPPTLLVVGARDVLLEDNLAMAARLSAAGVGVDLRVYPEAMHGFTSHPTSMAALAAREIGEWLAHRLA